MMPSNLWLGYLDDGRQRKDKGYTQPFLISSMARKLNSFMLVSQMSSSGSFITTPLSHPSHLTSPLPWLPSFVYHVPVISIYETCMQFFLKRNTLLLHLLCLYFILFFFACGNCSSSSVFHFLFNFFPYENISLFAEVTSRGILNTPAVCFCILV